MISEGVDIPRLAVGVYASKTQTPLFFRQVVGRFVRVRDDEELNARLMIPAVPELMRHAREIEEELRHQLELAAEQEEKARAEGRRLDASQGMLDFRDPAVRVGAGVRPCDPGRPRVDTRGGRGG
jgi:superfamily II DNA or RNA helicase